MQNYHFNMNVLIENLVHEIILLGLLVISINEIPSALRYGLLVQMQRILLFIKDMKSKAEPQDIDWFTCNWGMEIDEFCSYYGRKTSKLLPEFMAHGLLNFQIGRQVDRYELTVKTTTGRMQHTVYGESEATLEKTFFDSQLGKKVLYMAHLYRSETTVEHLKNMGPEALCRKLEESIVYLTTTRVEAPANRTRVLVRNLACCNEDTRTELEEDDCPNNNDIYFEI